jgi:peptide/nickel transport system permease protein
VLFGTLIGGFLGLFAGFKGGRNDTVISASFNIFLAFPQLVLALTLVSVFSPPGTSSARWSHRVGVVILAVGIVSIPILGRITRANTLAWSQREFVMAARAQGATDKRVMFREVLPNVVPAMLSIALLSVAVVIVLEGALAIFGLSIPAPSPSWGNMIQSQISNPNSAPTVWMVPSALILLTVLSLNYLGDVVRGMFDVREAAI